VKRKDILKKLADAGFTFEDGANHTKAYDPEGVYRTAIGRHTEIKEWTVKKIEKQTGVKMG
jgi:predicted RNA binding protein YcfA (HicA-like mRNA interferase family)